jgi:hypothetical protein
MSWAFHELIVDAGGGFRRPRTWRAGLGCFKWASAMTRTVVDVGRGRWTTSA